MGMMVSPDAAIYVTSSCKVEADGVNVTTDEPE
jgi:hypothetical protein